MKILIIGCGVVGAIHGWLLSEGKQNVTHFVHRNKISQLQNGIKLDIYDMRPNHNLTQVTVYYPKLISEITPTTQFDLVIVPLQHYQIIATLKEIFPKLPNAKYLLFGGNWEGLDEIDAIIPRPQYLLGYSSASGGLNNDNSMTVNIRPDYRIGDYDGTHQKFLQQIIDLFACADLKPDIKENMLHWLWIHHAMNGATLGTFLYFGFDSLDQPNFPKTFYTANLEAIEVLRKRGVPVEKYSDITLFTQNTPEQACASIRQRYVDSPIGKRNIKSGHVKTSPKEMLQFYFDVLTTGEQLGVPMPTLESFKDRLLSIVN